MAVIVSEFFGIIGVSQTAPVTMSQLIPWIMEILVGVCLVSAVFSLIGSIAFSIFGGLKVHK